MANYYIYVYKNGNPKRVPFRNVNRMTAMRQARNAARGYLTENADCGWSVHTSDGKAVGAGMWKKGIYHPVGKEELHLLDKPELE